MIEVILDASQLEVIEACPRKWYYDSIRNLTTLRTNPALTTGTFYHAVLQFYYSQPFPVTDHLKPTFEYAKLLADRGYEPENESNRWPEVRENKEFHLTRLRDYLIRWSHEDEAIRVVAVEKGFSYLLYEDTEKRFILEGMIDLIYRHPQMGLVVRDHKTQSRAYDKYPHCHQALNYLTATGGDYFEYNYIGLQKAPSPANFWHSEPFKPGPGVLDQWKRDVLRTFMEVYWIKRNELEVGTAWLREDLYARRKASCQTKFGMCQFHKICEVPETDPLYPNVFTAYKEKERRWKPWS